MNIPFHYNVIHLLQWIFRESNYSSNDDIHYFSLWSLLDLIYHDDAVVCYYPFTNSEIIIPITDIPDILALKYLFQNGKSSFYLLSQSVSWFLALPYDYALLPVECEIIFNNAPLLLFVSVTGSACVFSKT